jgi:hypothetical protein
MLGRTLAEVLQAQSRRVEVTDLTSALQRVATLAETNKNVSKFSFKTAAPRS